MEMSWWKDGAREKQQPQCYTTCEREWEATASLNAKDNTDNVEQGRGASEAPQRGARTANAAQCSAPAMPSPSVH